jgi:AcrR family transcriptional regulator
LEHLIAGRKTKKRASPGRPEGTSFAREKILRAAERAFADHGYNGTSLRLIVKQANVTQALITYYFGSKEALFKEIFLKRGQEISRKRLEALEDVRRHGKPFTLDEVVLAYLRPALEMRRTREGRAFIRLQARMHNEPPRFADRLRREVYDEAVRKYISAIQEAAPHLSARTAYWRMAMIIGAYLFVHSDAQRLQKMSGGICKVSDLDQMLAELTAFVVGGLKAADTHSSRKRTSGP